MVFTNEKNSDVKNKLQRLQMINAETNCCPSIGSYDFEDTYSDSVSETHQLLSAQFFKQIDVLRKSCNNFQGIHSHLSSLICKNDFKGRHDLMSLVQMMEHLVPSYSLDLLTTIVIGIGKQNTDCSCQKVRQLDIFKLLN